MGQNSAVLLAHCTSAHVSASVIPILSIVRSSAEQAMCELMMQGVNVVVECPNNVTRSQLLWNRLKQRELSCVKLSQSSSFQVIQHPRRDIEARPLGVV
eukprot:1361499-Amphidinium_carterae.1